MARQAGAVAFRDWRGGNLAEISVGLIGFGGLVDMLGALAVAAGACGRAGIIGGAVLGAADFENWHRPIFVVAAGADGIAPQNQIVRAQPGLLGQ
jgi:hypothetical protein